MNFYSFHIGDYAAHTRNLSLIEDLAYRRLLDAYYLAERPLNGCSTDVAREIGMRDNVAEVEYVLGKFFEFQDGAWSNKRADAEIEKYREKSAKASAAGKASAQRRHNGRSTDVGNKSTDVEKSATDVQLTNNQEPITNNSPTESKAQRKRSAPAATPDCPADVDTKTWADWLTLRKAKKAPVTETVLNIARREADAAGMGLDAFLQVWCMRGSQSLQADWIKPAERQVVSRASFAQQDELARRRKWEEMTGQKWPDENLATTSIVINAPLEIAA